MPISLHVHRWGTGPRVVLVHGGVLGGQHTWRAQRPLGDRLTLLLQGNAATDTRNSTLPVHLLSSADFTWAQRRAPRNASWRSLLRGEPGPDQARVALAAAQRAIRVFEHQGDIFDVLPPFTPVRMRLPCCPFPAPRCKFGRA